MIAGQEAAHPVRGCLYDVVGFALGAAVVIAAAATDPGRLLVPSTSAPPDPLLLCVVPFLALATLWYLARHRLILRLPAAVILGVYVAALIAGAVGLAIYGGS